MLKSFTKQNHNQAEIQLERYRCRKSGPKSIRKLLVPNTKYNNGFGGIFRGLALKNIVINDAETIKARFPFSVGFS